MAKKTRSKSKAETPVDDLDTDLPEVTYKSSRQEIWKAYKALREKYEQAQSSAPASEQAAAKKRTETVVAKARDVTVASVLSSVSQLKLAITEALNELAAKLSDRAERFAELEEAIAAQEARLTELRDLDLAAVSLGQLLEQHQTAEDDFQSRVEARRQEVLKELEEAKAEAQESIREQNQSFEEAKARREAEAEAADRERAQEREREQEAYEYERDQTRKKEEDNYQSRRQTQERVLSEEKARLEQSWAEREQRLAEREQELAELREQVAGFQGKLREAEARARSEAQGKAEQESKAKAALAARTFEGEQSLLKFKIESLESKVNEQAARIAELTGQLDSATTKVQDIALRAIEGAAGKQALSAVNEIALEQARKTRKD